MGEVIIGKAIALKWNVAEYGKFYMINLINTEHIYVSVCGSVSRKFFLAACFILGVAFLLASPCMEK